MSEHKSSPGKAIILIANALFWAAAILAAAYVFKAEEWSQDVILWGVFGYLTINGLLTAALLGKSQRCN